MATSIIKKKDDRVLKLYASVGNNIYHYTSPSGLKGILRRWGQTPIGNIKNITKSGNRVLLTICEHFGYFVVARLGVFLRVKNS